MPRPPRIGGGKKYGKYEVRTPKIGGGSGRRYTPRYQDTFPTEPRKPYRRFADDFPTDNEE